MSKIAGIIGRRIREYRMAKGMSQEELSDRSNLNTSHLGQIERGEKSPTLDTIEKIVHALGISFEELFNFHKAPSRINDPNIEKIVTYLRTMSASEQNDVLLVVRMLDKWKNK